MINHPNRRRPDSYEALAREIATAEGFDPDARIERPGLRPWPAWCQFRDRARAQMDAVKAAEVAYALPPQAPAYQNAPLAVFGTHEQSTLDQMRNCMGVGSVVAGVICADGHLGYAQPVGGVIAYEGQISISGVGFDIACGNMAVRLDTTFGEIRDRLPTILADIRRVISFGVGRTNDERVQHELLDDADAWRAADREDYRAKAASQLGTVGSGNHYVDILREDVTNTTDLPQDQWDAVAPVWIGVHFGSRGLGHSSATKYLKAVGAKDGIHVPPAVVEESSEVGQRYLAAMELAGRYAYAGREWVVERVRQIIGGAVEDTIHNHHNYAWRENHNGRDLWVVRKGATPAFPGERGFVGGSMGDDAVIVQGVDSHEAARSLRSTIHGAGRTFGRREAIRRFTKADMDAWLQGRGVLLAGGGIDESPMAYRRLPDVLAYHEGAVKVLHTLRPVAVAMAGEGEFDPWKD